LLEMVGMSDIPGDFQRYSVWDFHIRFHFRNGSDSGHHNKLSH
jgi:hypothetical protein